jgi:hypothetical protein
MDILSKIQFELVAGKNQRNNFGKYNYRSCEDILEGLKPLLNKYECSVTLTDDIVMVGNRIYVKSIAILTASPNGDNAERIIIASSSAFAREPESQKGMNEAQITGSASSYARKYALNGLFAIDDNKDADSNEHQENVNNRPQKKTEKPQQPKKDPKTLFDQTSDKIVRQYLGSGKLLDNQQQKLIKELESGQKVACVNLVDELIKEYGSLNA